MIRKAIFPGLEKKARECDESTEVQQNKMSSLKEQISKRNESIPQGKFCICLMSHALIDCPDVDPESHDPFAHTPDSDSDLEDDEETFTGREHYEDVGYD